MRNTRFRLPVAESQQPPWKWIAIGGGTVLLPVLLAMTATIGYLLGRQNMAVAPAQQVPMVPADQQAKSPEGRLATELAPTNEQPKVRSAAAPQPLVSPQAASGAGASAKGGSLSAALAVRPQVVEAAESAGVAGPGTEAPLAGPEPIDEPTPSRLRPRPVPPNADIRCSRQAALSS